MATGIRGFDDLTLGGLPLGRPTLLAGTTGSGKTIFAAEFCAQGIRQYNQPAVFVTFEEPPADIRTNVASLGFEIEAWEREGRWAFVDASPPLGAEVVVGNWDLDALVARITRATEAVGAARVVIDSIGAVFTRFADDGLVRVELTRLTHALKDLGVTALLTAERAHEYNSIARFGVEEFVADNVLILRNVTELEKRRRTIEILKIRGAAHRSGEYSFTITPGEGISVIPTAFISRARLPASQERVTLGNPELDAMSGGGAFRDAVAFVSGPSGTGKTLFATAFAAAGVAAGERALMVSYEESRAQILRNASNWGYDLEEMEASGLLHVVSSYPEVASLEDHFVNLRQIIDDFEPQRVSVDNLSALERVSTTRGLRDFIVGFTSLLRQRAITSLFTSTTSNLMGAESATESHASTLTDVILLLRYVETAGSVRRAVCVLKTRGSRHDTSIREFTIGNDGIHVGDVFEGLAGILSGMVGPWGARPGKSAAGAEPTGHGNEGTPGPDGMTKP